MDEENLTDIKKQLLGFFNNYIYKNIDKNALSELTILKYSIFEKIITKLLFQFKSYDYNINYILQMLIKDENNLSISNTDIHKKLETFLIDIINMLGNKGHIYIFYTQIIAFVLNLSKRLSISLSGNSSIHVNLANTNYEYKYVEDAMIYLNYDKININSIKDFSNNLIDNLKFTLYECDLKIEKMLCDHIDNTFFNNTYHYNIKKDKINNDNELTINEYFTKFQLDKNDCNYNYSFSSLDIVFCVIKKLEKINLILNDKENENHLSDDYSGLISEKKKYLINKYNKTYNNNSNNLSNMFDLNNKPKNIVEYFITEGHLANLLKELYNEENPSYYTFEIENKICLSLFIIKKIIVDFSFYFNKYELECLLVSLKKFKDFPLPIGSLGLDIFEILINELYLQGISMCNKLRSIYMIDSLNNYSNNNNNNYSFIKSTISDNKFNNEMFNYIFNKEIEVKLFNKAIIVYSNESYNSDIENNKNFIYDWLYKSTNNAESTVIENNLNIKNNSNNVLNNNSNDINNDEFSSNSLSFSAYNQKTHLSIKELLVSIFITIMRNSNIRINNDLCETIAKKMLSQPRIDYKLADKIFQKLINYDINNDFNEKSNEHNNILERLNDSTLLSIKRILRIIDVGLDKNHCDFMTDLQEITQKLYEKNTDFFKGNFNMRPLPITNFRDYCLPVYTTNKMTNNINKIENDNSNKINNTTTFDGFNNIIIEYANSFKNLFNNYFCYLDEDNSTNAIKEIEVEKKKKRKSLLNEFRLKIVLIDTKYSLKILLSQLEELEYYKDNRLFNYSNNNIDNENKNVNDNSFDNGSFNKNKLLYDKYNFDREFWNKFYDDFDSEFEIKYILYIIPEGDNNKISKNEEVLTSLSYYISNNDYIYQTLVYNIWNSKISTEINNINSFFANNDNNNNKTVTEREIYSCFKESLDMYVTDANKIYNVNLYKIKTISDKYDNNVDIKSIHKIDSEGLNTLSNNNFFWKNVKISANYSSKDYKSKKDFLSSGNALNINIHMSNVNMFGLPYENNTVSFSMNNVFSIKIYNVFSKNDYPLNCNTSSNNGWLEVFLSGKIILN